MKMFIKQSIKEHALQNLLYENSLLEKDKRYHINRIQIE